MTVTSSVQQVVRDIETHIQNNGGGYRAWYCGIASNPRDRLFKEHNVDEKNGPWIIGDCSTSSAARSVEQYFLDKGCQGDTGGGDNSTRYVYAYKITSATRE